MKNKWFTSDGAIEESTLDTVVAYLVECGQDEVNVRNLLDQVPVGCKVEIGGETFERLDGSTVENRHFDADGMVEG